MFDVRVNERTRRSKVSAAVMPTLAAAAQVVSWEPLLRGLQQQEPPPNVCSSAHSPVDN